MVSRAPVLLSCLFVAIAVGCGSSAANSGGGGGAGADALSDASGNDLCADSCGEPGTDALSDADSLVSPDATSDIDVLLTICPNVLKDKTLGADGKSCTKDADCAYGFCQKGGFLVGYDDTLGYCTKDCNCPDKSADCATDNVTGKEFTCGHEMSKSGGNDKAGLVPEWRCALRCKNDADCAPWNAAMPHCIQSTQYVSSSGICGFDSTK